MSRLRFSKLPAKERAKMAAAIRSGERVSEIAKAFGVSRRTVYNHKAQVEEIDLQSRTAVLTVRLNKQDVADLDKLAEREQLTRAETARRVLLRAVDVFQPEATEVEAFHAVGIELAKIGSNLNQIANAINAERKYGGLKSTDALEDSLDRMDTWIREVTHAANQIRYKIVMRAKQQRLRNEEVFASLSETPKNFMKAPNEAVEPQQAPAAPNEAPEAQGPSAALSEAIQPSQKPRRSIRALVEKNTRAKSPKQQDMFGD